MSMTPAFGQGSEDVPPDEPDKPIPPTPGNAPDATPEAPGSGMTDRTGDPAPVQGLVGDGQPTTIRSSPPGNTWTLEASGDYAGDEGTLVDAIRQCLAGFGVQSATFTSSWGEQYDVSNPNV